MAGEYSGTAASAPSKRVDASNFRTGKIDEKDGTIAYAPAELKRMQREAAIGFQETGGYFPGIDHPPVKRSQHK